MLLGAGVTREDQTGSAGVEQPHVQCEKVMTQLMSKLSCGTRSLPLCVYSSSQQ